MECCGADGKHRDSPTISEVDEWETESQKERDLKIYEHFERYQIKNEL